MSSVRCGTPDRCGHQGRRSALFGLLLVAACSDDSPAPIEFVGLRDGAVLGGEQVTRIEPTISLGALSVDLFLDDDRIGQAEFAPFTIPWTTTAFEEGPAELRAQVAVVDGSTLEAAIGVTIDNTPPELFGVSDEIAPGEQFEVIVTDANEIVHVTLAAGGIELDWDVPPFSSEWPLQCGPADVTMTAVDEAGWTTTKAQAVQTFYPTDHDCDGYESPDHTATGRDCNDSDPNINPGVVDEGPLGDVNCDGVPGTDADGDGVASVLAGGRDCDDLDPEIHPDSIIYARYPIEIEGEPVLWDPGTASAAIQTGPERLTAHVAINRGGAVELVTFREGLDATRMPLLKGINPGKVGLDCDYFTGEIDLFYSQGNQVWAARGRPDDLAHELILIADGVVEQLVVAQSVFEVSVRAVAIRVGTTIYLARDFGVGWQSQIVTTDAEPAPAPIQLTLEGYDPPDFGLHYVAGNLLRMAFFYGATTVPEFYDLDPVVDPAGMIGICPYTVDFTYDSALYGAGGCLLASPDPSEPVITCGDPIERLFCMGEDVYIQRSSGVVGHYDLHDDSIEYIAPIADAAFHGAGGNLFISPGSIYFVDEYISYPFDPLDGVDRNCNGLDE